MKVYVTAIVKSKPEFSVEVKAELEQLVILSNTEPACIQYDLHQSTVDSNVFVFYEIWASEEGLALHNEQPYMKTFGRLIEEKLEEAPTVHITKKL